MRNHLYVNIVIIIILLLTAFLFTKNSIPTEEKNPPTEENQPEATTTSNKNDGSIISTSTVSTSSENIKKSQDKPASIMNLPKSTWLWQSPLKLTEAEMQSYIDFLKREGFSTVYIDITDYIDIYESGDTGQVAQFTAKLATFTTLAGKTNINVEALVGGNKWSRPAYDYVPVTILDFVIEFNQQPQHTKLTGIQYDVESYNLPEFSNPQEQVTILTEYLTMVQKLTNKVANKSPNLRLGFAVPFWFDNYTRDLPLITFNKSENPVGFHVLDILQSINNGYIVIMDYRNKTSGTNGSIELAKPQINYANKYTPRVGVIIAQETTNVEPASITFFNQPKDNLNQALRELAQAFSYTKSLEGFAIHDIDGYKLMSDN